MTAEKKNKPKIAGADDAPVAVRVHAKKDARKQTTEQIVMPRDLPVLPVRNAVIFPGTIVPLAVGREKSARLLKAVLPDHNIIVTVCQKRPEVEDPTSDDLYTCGTATAILKLLRPEEGQQSIIIHALLRVQIEKWLDTEPYASACSMTWAKRPPRPRRSWSTPAPPRGA